MGRDNKYGAVLPDVIPDDEPVFVLRAQDALAEIALAAYHEGIVGGRAAGTA